MRLPPLCCLLLPLVLEGCAPAARAPIDEDFAARMSAPYDYYMNNMRTTRFDADGQLAYRLHASRITHYPEGDHAVLENPDLLWLSDAEAAWRLTALTGDLHAAASGDEDELLLEGDVQLASEPAPGRRTQIATESLRVLTLSREASTSAPVSLSSPGTAVQGVGMELRLEDNHVRLLNEVRGTYEP